MGIRVHKGVGYGLTDVEYEKYAITDPRINLESPLLVGGDDDLMRQSFFAWLEDQDYESEADKLFATQSAKRMQADLEAYDTLKALADEHDVKTRSVLRRPSWRYRLSSCVLRPGEYQSLDIICLRPPWLPDWQRYDDTIDYSEETEIACHGQQENWYRLLSEGIFPYNGFYMDKRTGETFRGEHAERVRLWQRLDRYDSVDADDQARQEQFDVLARTIGFDSHVEAQENIVPVVPDDIQQLVEWGELFTDDGTWRELRPMIYVYWG